MTVATIPPKDRPAAFAHELRTIFPTGQGLTAEVGLFTVIVKCNYAQAWAEVYIDRALVAQYANFNLRAGLEKARDFIEAECRKTLLLLGRHPDAQEAK